MNRSTIGGPIDLAALFGDRPDGATTHRPRDRREFQRAAHDLRGQGLSDRDIAGLLGITANGVAELLREPAPADVPARYRRPTL